MTKIKPTKVTNNPKVIGFLGDIHCGSHYGLWPREEMAETSITKGSRYLMDCYEHLVESWPELDVLILMGDLIDGKQRKSEGTGLYSTNLGDQVAGAICVLEPLVAKAKKVYRVEGTPYHEDFHGSLRELDRAFGATSRQILDLDINGNILNVAHHPSGGSAVYHGTTMDREKLWSKIATFSCKVPNARWIVRAHKHFFGLCKDADTTMVQTPCFELQTPHAVKQNFYRFQPDIGGVLMIADDSEPGGYRFREHLYKTPDRTVERLRCDQSQARRPGKKSTKTRGKASAT